MAAVGRGLAFAVAAGAAYRQRRHELSYGRSCSIPTNNNNPSCATPDQRMLRTPGCMLDTQVNQNVKLKTPGKLPFPPIIVEESNQINKENTGRSQPMIGETRQLVTDEPVEFEK